MIVATILLTVLAILPGTGYSSAQDSVSLCPSPGWPSESSRLLPDPSLVRGNLENGFRYVIKQNKQPKNRVAIYLDVQAGSLQESDDQRGLAHFLEHMMFNGSTRFPPGKLIDYFQSIGMNYGGDTNAHTTTGETVYHLILPGGSDKELESGLRVMADFARGALLLDSEINRERGVILAEKRARDSAEYRTNVASIAFAFRGTRYPERLPIGIEKTLEEADHTRLKAYYDAWYRPENMILVVVGDVNPARAAELIERQFVGLKAVGPSPPCPDFGKLVHRGVETFYHYEPELGETNVAIQSFWDQPLENDSLQLEKTELLRMVGTMILGYRLQRLQEEAKVPYVRAGYSSGDIEKRIGFGALSAKTDGAHWRETLGFLDRTLRQAIGYGFDKSEVDRAKKELLAQLDARVLTAESEDSRTIARRIIDHLNSNRVYQSAVQDKELYAPLLDQLSVADVNLAFQRRWGHDSRLVSVTGDVQLGINGAGEIAAVYRAATQEPVVAAISDTVAELPAPPTSAKVLAAPRSSYLKEIEVERLVFANGLQVNLKKTPFEEHKILLRADFGAGKQLERLPGMAMLVEGVVNGSGTGKLLQSAIDQLIAGSSIAMSFNVNESAFTWTGSALTKDFDLFCQMLRTLLLDPGFRKNIFIAVKENTELMYQQLSQEIEGAFPLKIEPFLATGNDHFGLPAWDTVAKLDFDSLALWARSRIRPEQLEISLVGDFNRDQVVAVLGKYFSGMELAVAERPEVSPVIFPAGQKLAVTVNTSVEKSLIAVAWPTEDFWEIQRTRRLNLLAGIFGDRLRKIIREKLAASYSPNVFSVNSRVYPGYGYIVAQMLVKPGAEEMVINQILAVSEQLQKEGISPDELARAKGPLLTSLHEGIRTNQYWLNSVLSLSARHPQQLEWPNTILSDYSSISQAEIGELAARYLDNRQAAVAKVTPGKPKQNEGVVELGRTNETNSEMTN